MSRNHYDYRSNITGPDLRYAFPHAVPFTIMGHTVYHDDTFDLGCGYMSADEAAILYTIARDFPGLWAEIGSHTGWSGAHIARALSETEGRLVAMEPRLVELDFYERTLDNWYRADVIGYIQPVTMRSDQYFACGGSEMFSGAFVDGDHDPPMPERDAQLLLPRLSDRAVVVFHDFSGWPVRDGVRYLMRNGFNVRVYDTAQMLGVCWRGEWEPPVHVADPGRDWPALRATHTDFDYSLEWPR